MGSDPVALASQGVLVGSLGAYSGLTRDLSRPHLAHLRTDGQQASAVEERLQGCSRGGKNVPRGWRGLSREQPC